ncbi:MULTISPECIES: hypothetical protein [unclassified Mesorhizobium]|uniref:hypothetical protein n=1 Tax=unclassified Mesorhizobium TaxID=325217 RepID=UPI00333A8EC2
MPSKLVIAGLAQERLVQIDSVGGEAGQNPTLLPMPKISFRSMRTRMPSCSMMNSPVCP